MNRKKCLITFILLMLTVTVFANEINLIAVEPLAIPRKQFSAYYSKVSPKGGSQFTFPLKYQELTDYKKLTSGIVYRTYVEGEPNGFYFEGCSYFDLLDRTGSNDTFSIIPAFTIGYRIDTEQGIFIEPEGYFYYPISSTVGSPLKFAEKVSNEFRITVGLDNIWPNGFFLAPRATFSYKENSLFAIGHLYVGYGF